MVGAGGREVGKRERLGGGRVGRAEMIWWVRGIQEKKRKEKKGEG